MKRISIGSLAATIAWASCAAVQAAEPGLVSTEKIAWRTAVALASDAVAACSERGYGVVATVIDPAGRQQAVVAGDAAVAHSVNLSFRKAYTAFAFGKIFNKNSSAEVVEFLKDKPAAAALSTVPEASLLGGGVTIRKSDGTVLGAIGVSGAPGSDKDEACARAALERHKTAWK